MVAAKAARSAATRSAGAAWWRAAGRAGCRRPPARSAAFLGRARGILDRGRVEIGRARAGLRDHVIFFSLSQTGLVAFQLDQVLLRAWTSLRSMARLIWLPPG